MARKAGLWRTARTRETWRAGELAELCGRGGRREGEGAKDQLRDSVGPGVKDQAGRFGSAARARRDDTGGRVYGITGED